MPNFRTCCTATPVTMPSTACAATCACAPATISRTTLRVVLAAGMAGAALAPLPQGAQAATAAPMEVVAMVTPAACTLSLSNGGQANYGVMTAGMLRNGRPTALPELSLGVSVSCDVAAKFSLRLIDNRAASVVPGILAAGSGDTSLTDDHNFGLGTSSGRKVGGYLIRFQPNTYAGDYQPVQLLGSADGNHWSNLAGGLGSKRLQISWGQAGDHVVGAYKVVSGRVSVQAFINKPGNLSMAEEVVLDGLTTVELLYL